MSDATSTLRLAGFKRRYERLAQEQQTALAALLSAKYALEDSAPKATGDGPAQIHAMALEMVINTIGVIESRAKMTSFGDKVSARMEGQDPGQPKMPFSPARGALGCLAVACVLGMSAAIMFGVMGLLWHDPWRFMWASLALGAGSVLLWAALYRRSHKARYE